MYSRYGFLHALFDLVMIGLTGGLWLLYIFVRYLRRNS